MVVLAATGEIVSKGTIMNSDLLRNSFPKSTCFSERISELAKIGIPVKYLDLLEERNGGSFSFDDGNYHVGPHLVSRLFGICDIPDWDVVEVANFLGRETCICVGAYLDGRVYYFVDISDNSFRVQKMKILSERSEPVISSTDLDILDFVNAITLDVSPWAVEPAEFQAVRLANCSLLEKIECFPDLKYLGLDLASYACCYGTRGSFKSLYTKFPERFGRSTFRRCLDSHNWDSAISLLELNEESLPSLHAVLSWDCVESDVVRFLYLRSSREGLPLFLRKETGLLLGWCESQVVNQVLSRLIQRQVDSGGVVD